MDSPKRTFLYGFALGLMVAIISSYYHFCRPQAQSVTELFSPEAIAAFSSAPTSPTALD